MKRPWLPVALAVALSLAVPAAAQTAENDGDGTLSAFACEALPTPLAVEFTAQDDSAGYARLAKVLVEALAARQAAIQPNAPMTLSLYVETLRETEQRKGRDLGEFSRGNRNDERTQFRMNIWSNQRDSVVGGRRDTVLSQAVDQLMVSIAIHDKRNGRCIWQGEARVDLDGRNEAEIAERMIPLVAAQLGRTVRAKPFQLD